MVGDWSTTRLATETEVTTIEREMTRLVILGRQGAGKGTQCVMLAEHYGIPHISTGDILRAAVAEGSDLGRRAKAIMDAGDLVSDEIMLGIIEERLARPDADRGFLLDGFPRTAAQADGLVAMLDPATIDLAVSLEVPDEIVIERMLARGRADDTAEAITRRLALYEEQTAPLVAWFSERDKLVRIDGVGDPEEISKRIFSTIDAHV
jgi:adenylate kinase